MRFPLKRVWSVIRDNRYAKYVLLALAPAVAQPLDYEPPAKRIHARMRGLYLLPIIPAWWWGQINDSLVGWITWRQMLPGASDVAPSDLFVQSAHTQRLVQWGAALLMAGLIYSVALVRWLYHVSWATALTRFGVGVRHVRLKFFVLQSAAWAFWFTAAGQIMVWIIWESNGNVRGYLHTAIASHPDAALAIVGGLGLAVRYCAKVQRKGMQAVYGGSWKVLLLVDSTVVGTCFLLLFVLAQTKND